RPPSCWAPSCPARSPFAARADAMTTPARTAPAVAAARTLPSFTTRPSVDAVDVVLFDAAGPGVGRGGVLHGAARVRRVAHARAPRAAARRHAPPHGR